MATSLWLIYGYGLELQSRFSPSPIGLRRSASGTSKLYIRGRRLFARRLLG